MSRLARRERTGGRVQCSTMHCGIFRKRHGRFLLLWRGEGGFSASSSTLRLKQLQVPGYFRESAEVMNRGEAHDYWNHVPRRAGRKIGARPVRDSRAVSDAVSHAVGAIRMRRRSRTWPLAGSVLTISVASRAKV